MFDAHSHWLPAEIIEQAHFFSPAWGDIEKHLELMDGSGVERALLLYPTSDAHRQMGGHAEAARVYNDAIAEVVNRYPARFTGAAILPVDQPAEMVKELNRAEGLGFRAISLATSCDGIYLDDERFDPLYERAQGAGIPIFVHPQTINPIGYERLQHPLLTPVIEFVFDTTVCIGRLMTGGVFRRYPELKFVFAHFGGVMPFIKERFDSVYQMLRGRNFTEDLHGLPSEYLRRIYVDTSGASSPHALMCTLDMVGAEHTLWGSDYPGNPDVAASIDAIEGLDIPSDDREKILGGNIARLLGGG